LETYNEVKDNFYTIQLNHLSMKKFVLRFTLLVILFATVSCKKSKEVAPTVPVVPTPPPPVATNLITLPAGWKVSTTLGTSFPAGIQVYQFDSTFQGQTIKAFCLAYDSKNINFEFKPVMAATATTPTSFYNAESGSAVYACINGGFYGGNQSFSLVKYNNAVSSANIKAVTRSFNGTNTSYFPTRAAFGVSSTGVPSVAWIYNVGSGNDLIYSYPSPSPNALNTAPQAVPTATFPSGGSIWNTSSAIGGSPMLLKANTVNITATEELIEVNNTSSRPRSGIGYTANGIVLMVAVEGDNAPTYSGINLANFAALLKSLGCTDAINLDGGGSTSMVIGGSRTVRPGEGGVERPVISAIIIKRK
jgi:hypothetical protein